MGSIFGIKFVYSENIFHFFFNTNFDVQKHFFVFDYLANKIKLGHCLVIVVVNDKTLLKCLSCDHFLIRVK